MLLYISHFLRDLCSLINVYILYTQYNILIVAHPSALGTVSGASCILLNDGD